MLRQPQQQPEADCRSFWSNDMGFCGGGAFVGLSGTVCGLFEATDNRNLPPNQVVFGFADEFIKRLESAGGLAEPVRYGKTFTRMHDPLVWRETGDGFLEESGVQILFHTTVTGVLSDGGERIEGVTAYSKEGPMEIRAGITVEFWTRVGQEDAKALAFYKDAGNEIIVLDADVQKQAKKLSLDWAQNVAAENEWFARILQSQIAFEELWKDASFYRNVITE